MCVTGQMGWAVHQAKTKREWDTTDKTTEIPPYMDKAQFSVCLRSVLITHPVLPPHVFPPTLQLFAGTGLVHQAFGPSLIVHSVFHLQAPRRRRMVGTNTAVQFLLLLWHTGVWATRPKYTPAYNTCTCSRAREKNGTKHGNSANLHYLLCIQVATQTRISARSAANSMTQEPPTAASTHRRKQALLVLYHHEGLQTNDRTSSTCFRTKLECSTHNKK